MRYLAQKLYTDYVEMWRRASGPDIRYSSVLGRFSKDKNPTAWRTPLYIVRAENTQEKQNRAKCFDSADHWSIMVLEKGEPISADTEAEIKEALEELSE